MGRATDPYAGDEPTGFERSFEEDGPVSLAAELAGAIGDHTKRQFVERPLPHIELGEYSGHGTPPEGASETS